MRQKISRKNSFILILFLFFFSGCSLKEKLNFSDQNPAIKKPTELTNAQKINQQALNNPTPLVPASPKNNPAENSLEKQPDSEKQESSKLSSIGYDAEKWRTLSSQYRGAILKTNFGNIELTFFSDQSPLATGNFIELAQKKFYDQTKFHRIIKDFMIQGGDPNSKDEDWSDDGKGGPGYKFPDEQGSEKLIKGTLAMANSGPNTNGSQFFIVTAKSTEWLDGKHTVFGKVANEKSLDIIKKIEKVKTNDKDHPLENVIVEGIELLSIKKEN